MSGLKGQIPHARKPLMMFDGVTDFGSASDTKPGMHGRSQDFFVGGANIEEWDFRLGVLGFSILFFFLCSEKGAFLRLGTFRFSNRYLSLSSSTPTTSSSCVKKGWELVEE